MCLVAAPLAGTGGGGSCPNFPPPSLFLSAGVGKFRETEAKPKDPSTLIFKLRVGAAAQASPPPGVEEA